MARIRVSTTVSDTLLEQARSSLPELNDAALLDRALAALCADHRNARIDRSYQVFDDLPLSTEDGWGDLESFLEVIEGS
ncbi:MAG: antitoxin MazE5 [Acidimicrobiaceae bacterium]|nr:antitoxin MazE5 [Acidimicrobiaceae bacterium]MXW60297.1 antitoxin MazE5 [Acidimicrobiaceae bacterium]MXW76290.1 antitoxin MazE5 [Acidimicrobiaceae bacterium]MYA74491.1 antitoxin MazE5 [Acidimicrobiaceae bacterium]MYC43866.1 antitoxin MazE5 [Acidimicrobiaceae bacterium]